MPINNFGEFLQLLKNIKPAAGGRYEALCPAHPDERRSLSVWLDGDKILVKCHAGCTAEQIVKSMGLEMKDLFLSHPEKPKPVRAPNADTKKLGEISNIYQYTDEKGKLLFEVVKYKPKDFRQRQPDGKGGYVWNIQGIKPTLYRLPEVLEALKNKQTIFIPEGEKDADNIRAYGLTATTSPMGAGPGKWKDAHSIILKGADVVVVADVDPVPEKKKPDDPDKEPAGIAFAKEKCYMLNKVASRVRLFVPPVGIHEDISDWIERGGTKEQFLAMVDALPSWEPAPEERVISPDRYIIHGDKGQILNFELLVNDLLKDYHFVTFGDTEEILVYQDGVYANIGKQLIKSECQNRVGVSKLIGLRTISEIIGHIQRSTFVDRSKFNTSRDTINVKNGLLNINTRTLSPHNPKFLSTMRVPVNFDANADCPVIKKFLSEVIGPEDILTMQEWAGYCLLPQYIIQKAVLLQGDGDNGKSTYLNLLKAFVGRENCSNVSWQSLEFNRFASSQLEGKMVNIFADLPSQSVNMTTAFKTLTGGDQVESERKFQNKSSFLNFAKLIFSANKPPVVKDENSYAFWRRWLLIEFPNQIPENRKDPKLLEKLTADQELSGFLNYALDGFDRLMKQGKFTYNKTVEQTTELYQKTADTVYAFVADRCDVSSDSTVSKDELYDAYKDYCTRNKLPNLKPNSFARSLQNQESIHVKSVRLSKEGGERYLAWQGLSVRAVSDFSDDVSSDNPDKGDFERVRVVRDVRVLPLDKYAAEIEKNNDVKGENIYINNYKGKNPDIAGNPDITLDSLNKNPDSKKLAEIQAAQYITDKKYEVSQRLGLTVDRAVEVWTAAGEPPLQLGERLIEDLGEVLIFDELTDGEIAKISKWLKMQET